MKLQNKIEGKTTAFFYKLTTKTFTMRHLILLIAVATLFSCGQNDTKQKELELKEKELELRQKELNLKESDIRKGS